MTSPVMIEKIIHGKVEGKSVPIYREMVVYCPGCECRHDLTVELLNDKWTRGDGSPPPVWEFDGNMETPTFSPSLLCYSSVHICRNEHEPTICDSYGKGCEEKGHNIGVRQDDGSIDWHYRGMMQDDRSRWVYGHDAHTRENVWGNCHSFIRKGIWEFLGDCEHSLAGQNVPMVPLPDWMVD